MANVTSYDPGRVIVALTPISGLPPFRLTGFMEDSMIDIAWDENEWDDSVGVLGDTTRIKNLNYNAVATVSLQQSSSSNGSLDTLRKLDRSPANNGYFSFALSEAGTFNIIGSGIGWIRKQPNVTYNKGISGREWELRLTNLKISMSGNFLV